MNKIVNLWELEKSNEVVDYYPTISAQEIKPTSKETNNQTNEKKNNGIH